MNAFYTDLADLWPLISPVEDYADEAAEIARVLQAVHPTARTLLELGSGGGHVASYLRGIYTMTLTDLAAPMLDVSRRLNPGCEHIVGDMRTMRLGRTFDIVFAHDAVDYMTTESDLAAAIATALAHCAPGGVAVFLPDAVAERFDPSSDHGGADGPDGRGVRYLEWSHDPDTTDTEGQAEYAFLVRDRDGHVRVVHETHRFGLFPERVWRRLFAEAGFEVEVVEERTDDDRQPRLLFVGRRPGPSGS